MSCCRSADFRLYDRLSAPRVRAARCWARRSGWSGPEGKGPAGARFADDLAAAEAVPALLPYKPLTIEGMDHRIVALTGAAVDLPPGGAWLFVEVGGDHIGEVTDRAATLASVSDARHRLVVDPAEQRCCGAFARRAPGWSLGGRTGRRPGPAGRTRPCRPTSSPIPP